MTPSAFADRSAPPEPGALKDVLGASLDLWEQLVAHVSGAAAPVALSWNFSGAKHGWSLRLKHQDRILVYMTPLADGFLLGVVLGERAAAAAHESGAPDAVLALIDGAPRYGEGRGIRMVVATDDDLAVARILADLKMAR
jgi:hypothetical protein